MSSLVIVAVGGLLPAILPCHDHSAGICRREGKGAIEEGRFGKPPKGKAASSRRTPKGPSQKTALHGCSIRQRWSSQFGVSNRKSAGKSAYATYLSMAIQLGFHKRLGAKRVCGGRLPFGVSSRSVGDL